MEPFDLPPYPYDRLNEYRAIAAERHGTAIDMSIGAPFDAPPQIVVDALSASGAERGYPPSIGSEEFRTAASTWLSSQFNVDVEPMGIGATMGLKEFVAGLPHWLRLKDPSKDTVLYPAVAYPSYAMGARLAHSRAVSVPVDENWRLRFDAIAPEDVERAGILWVASPGNPTGALEDLDALAQWGRDNDVLIVSDECYIEFTWDGSPRTILENGLDGVLAVHSLSKRSNLAGLRAGFYTGDPSIVHWCQEIRKHTGAMVGGPNQHAAAVAFGDQDHVAQQRETYRRRMLAMIDVLARFDVSAEMPQGGFYLWAQAPGGDAWALAERLAQEIGLIVSPGEFYGDVSDAYIRVAVVQSDDKISQLLARAEA